MPLANSFKAEGEEQDGYVPLTLLWCERCQLAQLREVVSPEILYSGYSYRTSESATMLAHFESLWAFIKQKSPVESVIEIGSNTGAFLKFALANGAERVCGVDPAGNLAELATKDGITTIVGLFDSYSANIVGGVVPIPNVIIARHVFAHVNDWSEFINNLGVIARKDTLIAIEVPSLVDMLSKVQWETAYHEHLSYVSISSIEHLLKGTVFHLHAVRNFDIMGGSIVFLLRRNDCEKYPDSIPSENITEQSWQTFSNDAHAAINHLRFKVEDLLGLRSAKRTGKTIAGFGASAKSTVWISACGFTHNEIKFICDCTPNKQGKFSPGTSIPIVPESELMKQKPDYAIIFSGNFKDEIISKNQNYLDAGGKFLIPGKRIEII